MNRTWLVTWWPRLVAAGVVLVVLAPAAVASYLHARHVVQRHDPTMANWLPITTDGMLLAALVVIWARRATRDPAGRWVWLAFWLGGVVTVAANLAAVLPTTGLTLAVEAVVVAVWPPVTVAITLELAMLLAMAIRVRHLVPAPVQAPPATDGGLPAAGGEVGSGGGRPPEIDTTHETGSTPPDPEARLYARVVDLMGQGYGRPRVKTELGITEGKARTLMGKARKEWAGATSTNGNGSGHG